MDAREVSPVYINILESQQQNEKDHSTSISDVQIEQTPETTLNTEFTKQDSKYNSAIWTTDATTMLLKLYEEKLEMLQTPKKKTKIWIAISKNLRENDIDVSADQVRWKINALTKKYKHSIDIGKHEKFKYFKEMDNIYAKYNVDCNSYLITEFLSKKKLGDDLNNFSSKNNETKASIEMRKARLKHRINCDRFQGKNKLERQWLEYLHKREEEIRYGDKMFEKKLKLREEKLENRKRELEIKKSFEYRKLQLMEKEQEELLLVEREKLELLKQIIQ